MDVTTSQLAWKLQQDARVTPIEVNVRYLDAEGARRAAVAGHRGRFLHLRGQGAAAPGGRWRTGAEFLILVKPQFELERGDMGRGGIVRDARLHQKAVERVRAAAVAAGLEVLGVRPSHVLAPRAIRSSSCTPLSRSRIPGGPESRWGKMHLALRVDARTERTTSMYGGDEFESGSA